MRLTCPVTDHNDEPCEADIRVDVNPHEGVAAILHAKCGHMAELESGSYDNDLINQAIERDAQARDDAVEQRIDAARERHFD